MKTPISRPVRPASILGVPLALLLALILAGCGGGGSSTTASTSGSAATGGSDTTTAPSAAGAAAKGKSATGGSHPGAAAQGAVPGDTGASFTPPAHHDSGGGSAQFKAKGGDNSIQESGSEASSAQLAQAAADLHGYLDARAGGAWRAACSHMTSTATASFSQLATGGQGAAQSCPKLLANLFAGMPAYAKRDTTIADVGALRVKGDSAYLLFHGAHSADYFMPMAREDGRWKVAAVAASALG
jgi:hypothetical protein